MNVDDLYIDLLNVDNLYIDVLNVDDLYNILTYRMSIFKRTVFKTVNIFAYGFDFQNRKFFSLYGFTVFKTVNSSWRKTQIVKTQ